MLFTEIACITIKLIQRIKRLRICSLKTCIIDKMAEQKLRFSEFYELTSVAICNVDMQKNCVNNIGQFRM